MKLSMWIFADWLKEYQPELHIRDGKLEIETVRLFSSQSSSDDDNCLYVGRIRDLFLHGNNNVLCTHKNDIIILPTNEIDEVMNQILNAFEYYQRWNVRTLEAISTDRRPSDLLTIANEVIREPIYLLDSNQFSLALSDGYDAGSINHLWDQMLMSGSADLPFLQRLDREYPQHRTTRGLYRFEAPFVKDHSYNYNMFLGNTWIGACSMIERQDPIPRHTVDLFHIFCQNIELWYVSHSQEQQSMLIDSQFREALMSENGVSDAFLRQCQIRFHDPNAVKYLLVLDGPADQTLLMSHVCREFNLIFPDLIAVLFQSRICVLTVAGNGSGTESNRDSSADSRLLPAGSSGSLHKSGQAPPNTHCPPAGSSGSLHKSGQAPPNTHCPPAGSSGSLAVAERFSSLLGRTGYHGGISSAFMDFGRIRSCFLEASYVLEHCPRKPGRLYDYQDYALPHILQKIRTQSNVMLIHPDVLFLMEYDQSHHTDFAHTLEVWLQQERSQSKTAAALHIHRNTLTYRLLRLQELLTCDLEDADTRLRLMLSFRLV